MMKDYHIIKNNTTYKKGVRNGKTFPGSGGGVGSEHSAGNSSAVDFRWKDFRHPGRDTSNSDFIG
jgi:hypothetical protein